MGMATSSSGRVVSMDQFRGYTVAGMFLVNFIGHFAAVHAVLRHNNNYFSYADSIMPSFIFAVGFSYRLTFMRRLGQVGWTRTCLSYVRRSLALVFVSMTIAGLGGGFGNIGEFDTMPNNYLPQRAMAHAPSPEFFARMKTEMEAIKEPEPPKKDGKELSEADKAAQKKQFEELRKQVAEQRAVVQKKYADEDAAARASFVDVEIKRRQDFESLNRIEKVQLRWKMLLLRVLKNDLWETLAIIGLTQIVLLPVIAAPGWVRVLAFFALGAWDLWMAQWFNWEFVYGYRENWMVRLWGTGDQRSFDGGFFGPLTWGVAMLGGTITHDIMKTAQTVFRAAGRLFAWGAALMVLGYGLSCLTRLYEYSPDELAAHKASLKKQGEMAGWLGGQIARINAEIRPTRDQLGKAQGEIDKIQKEEFDALVKKFREQPGNADLSSRAIADLAEKHQRSEPAPNPKVAELKEQMAKLKADPTFARKEAEIAVITDEMKSFPNPQIAPSPVLPPWDKLRGRGLRDLLVEPPFVAPPADDPRVDPGPHEEHRAWNYWMMGKRMPSLSFILFATGFAFALYGLFVIACDAGRLRIGVFRTFGMNPLAAYIIHEMMSQAVAPLVPHDAPLYYCLAGFFVFFGATYFAVRYLEKNEIYLRL